MGNISDKKEKINLLMKQNWVFLPFLLLLALLMLQYPQKISHFQKFVDWKTIINLTGLLVVVTGIKESAFIGKYSKRFLVKTRTERGMAYALVLMAGVLSMFLTNDIALFITVPLTLGFAGVIRNDVKKLVIFEALAVNAGSALTPVGNPQNLFLWHQWGISFLQFAGEMFPLFLVLMLLLLLFVRFAFPAEILDFHETPEKKAANGRLFIVSVVLLAIFIVSIEFDKAKYALAGVVLVYLFFYRRVFLRTDWALLLLFMVMFVDFHLLSLVPVVRTWASAFHLPTPAGAYAGSVFFSQWMSNVPAAIFVSKFSHQWRAVAFGVNVGGNGLVVASLANLIALRFVKRKSLWIDFHKYSLLYLLVSATAVYFLFFV